METRFFSVIFFLLLSGILRCQTSSEIKLPLNPFTSVIPKSPEAASLSKYAEFPVSYFYGLPQIDLPLYELNIKDFSFPISLSYHGGGIKVDEVASRVGLGWTLNAGGVISRQVCGLPDEMREGSYSGLMHMLSDIPIFRGFYHLLPPDKESIQYNMQKVLNYDPSEYYSSFQQLNLYKQIRLFFNFEGGYMDSALDRYTFNFMGYSGAFMMSQPRKDSVIIQSGSPVEIVEMSFPDYFVMRDQKDIRYYFEEKETSLYPYYPMSNPNVPSLLTADSLRYTSAWYLSKIVTPGKDTVYLNYSQMPLVKIQSGIYAENMATYSPDFKNEVVSAGTATYNTVQFLPKRLDKISSRDVDISFISDENPRLDIKGDRTKLDYIKVSDKKRGLIKKLGFRYSYFCNTVRYNSSEANALKLDGIDEFSVSNTDSVSLHRFTYYGDGYRPRDHGQDHWGYYNGTVGGLVPPFSEQVFNGITRGDRKPTKDGAKYGVLTHITYPTGGYTNFNWEPNAYSYVGAEKFLIEKNEMEYYTVGDTLCGLPEGENLKVEIYATTTNKIHIQLNEYYNGLGEFLGTWMQYYYNYPDNNPWHGQPEPEFPSIYVYYLGKDKSEQNKKMSRFRLLNKDLELYPTLEMTPEEDGYYQIELRYPRETMVDQKGFSINTMFTDPLYYRGARYGHIPITLKIPTNLHIRETVGQAGGLRIRSISSFAGVGDTIIKTYTYGDPDLSSGVLTDFPDYSGSMMMSYQVAFEDPKDHFPSRYQNFVRVMTSEGLYNTIFGKPRVEYGWVRESFISTDNPETIGNVPGIDYYYTTVRDNIMDAADLNESNYGNYEPPVNRLRTSKSHWRGNLKRKVYWKRPGTINDSKEISYDYYIHEDRSDHYFPGGLYTISAFNAAGIPLTPEGYDVIEFAKNDYGMTKFRIIPYNKMLKEQHEITTTSSGAIEETLRYTYPFTGYNKSIQATLPLSKELENSKGEKIVIYYTYYRNTDKVETEVRVENGYITDAVRMQYDDYARITATYSALLPQAGVPVASYPLGTSLKTPAELMTLLNIREYEYLYDSQNNLRDIYYKGDHVASFLWAYNGSHPVAEFKKRNSEEVDSFLREIGTDRGSFLKESSEVKTKLDHIRTLHPDVEMRSMSYHWLVGIASETDARGVTTYYNYDGYGRLSTIKDYNNYLIRKHTYHYKTR